jgi:hypothetical protein
MPDFQLAVYDSMGSGAWRHLAQRQDKNTHHRADHNTHRKD